MTDGGKRKGRPPRTADGPAVVTPVRFTERELERLSAAAERAQITVSEAIRAAVREWVDKNQ